jgi:gamma-glutamyl hercynylcysteine S-oxide synthase
MNPAYQTRVDHIPASLEERFLSAWSRSDELFRLIKGDDLLQQPIFWRHPFIFYVGHLPAFSWIQVSGAIATSKSFNAYFDDLFCRGIDPDVDTGECHWHPDVPDKWPERREVEEYRDSVRAAILQSIDIIPQLSSDDLMAQNGRVFELVLEHEYMHQETLLYMMQELPFHKKNRPAKTVRYSFQPAPASMARRIASGKARLGAKFSELDFGWDNEFSETVIEVPAFTIDSLPVTNGEFLEFVQSGAYQDEHYWRGGDWHWKTLTNREHPNFWFKRGDAWFFKSMFDVFSLAQVSSWPVYVTVAEARAFAAWRGKRLPTEAEFHRASYSGPDGSESRYPWGDAAPARRHGNFDFASWSPQPVGSHPAGASRWGVEELVGNGWEWTDTAFAPFPGFTPYMSRYPDYSKDFFDGKHFVVKGGSWATAAELLRSSFRNWYQGHYPYVFAKFRCASSD